MQIRVCPCGERLEQKSYESEAQFERRKYCGTRCKGKYHRDPPRENGFGLAVPKDKTQRRVGKGMMAFFVGTPGR
jgi:hypothetical protein